MNSQHRGNWETKREILELLLRAAEHSVRYSGKTIKEHVGFSAPTVSRHLTQLEQKGYVRQHARLRGHWDITEAGRIYLGEPPRGIGLYGSIAAGPAIPETTEPEGFLFIDDLDASMHVAFRVRGTSMEHCRIYDGDIVIIRKVEAGALIAPNTIVAVLVPDENSIHTQSWEQKARQQRRQQRDQVFELPLDHITLKVAVLNRSHAYAMPSEGELILQGNGVSLFPSSYKIVGTLVRSQRNYPNGKMPF